MVRRINKAAVIGSGIMGGGIAALLAAAGVEMLLLDIVPFDLKEEEKKDKKARNRIVTAGLEGAMKAKPPLFYNKDHAGRISTGNLEDDFDKLAECDWIIEVVVENLKIKQQLFARIDKVRKADAIVSSNTSGIPLKAMSEGLSKGFKEHFLGTHFFNPVRYMHLLEIIPGELTKKEVLDFVAEFGESRLGKGIVWAKDTPNFIGNRIGIHGIGATLTAMLEEGFTIPEVDAIFGAPLGRPKTAIFATGDLVGLDTMTHVMKNTYDLCADDEARDVFKLPDFLQKMLDQKLLGNKTKAGFYKKEIIDWKRIKKVINPKTGEYETYDKVSFPCIDAAKKAKTLPEKLKAVLYGDDKGAKFAWKVQAAALIYAANRIPEISDTVVEIDNAMKWGYNFEMGPFETWDAIGVKESVEKMEKDGLKVPDKVKKMLKKGATSFYKLEKGKPMFFDFVSESYKPVKVSPKALSLANVKVDKKKIALTSGSCSLIDIGDGVYCLEFHSKMNAVNLEMVEFMQKAGAYVGENGVGMVIGNQAGGMPGAFSAGGDLAFMLGLARAGKFDEIDGFIRKVHTGIMATRYSNYPVVAAPYGLTLGGGCEVCLSADRIVAHADLFMGLVEIGAGLVPGGCGMINLWRRYITSKPEEAKVTDYAGFFINAFMAVAQAKVSNSAEQARARGFLTAADRIVMNRDNLIGEAKKEVLKMVDDGYAPPIKKNIPVFGREAHGMIWAEMNNMKGGGYITPHMEFIAKKAAVCMSGGDVPTGTPVSEEHLMTLEREAFVDLWRTENTQKMAEHIMTTGKPLFL